MRRSTSRGFGVEVSHLVRRFRLSCSHALTSPKQKIHFLITLEAVEHEDPYAFDSFVYASRMRLKSRAYIGIDNTS